MNKLALLLVAAPSIALADPAGESRYVLPYNPPIEVDSSHRGLTLEVSLGGAAADSNSGAVTFAIGGWIDHDLALALRATAMGNYTMVAASAQYTVIPKLWLGAGVGALRERFMDYRDDASGFGGFARVGYDLVEHGSHALYVSAELQVGSVDSSLPIIGAFAIGYQLL